MCWPTAAIRPRGAFATSRAADCACQYRVAAAVHGGRTAVRPAGRRVVGHASGRGQLLGDHGRGAGRRPRPGVRGWGPGLRAAQAKPSAWRTRKSVGTPPARATRCNRDPAVRRYVSSSRPFPSRPFPPPSLRWQVELVFKRFKSLAQFKGPPAEVRRRQRKAWLYGKLFALRYLVEKLIHHDPRDFPLGRRRAGAGPPPKPVATSSSCSTRSRARIEPPLPLARLFSDWRTISGALAEPPRRRQPQLSAYFGWTELQEDHATVNKLAPMGEHPRRGRGC